MSALLTSDPWAALGAHTPARIALGRTGDGLPTDEVLRFAAAHAMARDAVHLPLDVAALEAALSASGFATLLARSQAADRASYLRRPDLGRQLDADSADRFGQAGAVAGGVDLALVVADGLSARAAQQHALPLLVALREQLTPPLSWAPIVVATMARVALADSIGALLKARVVAIALGERPGLSAPDSLGVYLTYAPRPGRLDAERNCISNIRPEGLTPEQAATKLAWLIGEALRRRVSGVGLKDDSGTPLVTADVDKQIT
jgi:ethanolamine ammonia-lyase small subunit